MILRDVMHKAIDSACDQATNLKAKVQIASAVTNSGVKEVSIAGREKVSEFRKNLNQARMESDFRIRLIFNKRSTIVPCE